MIMILSSVALQTMNGSLQLPEYPGDIVRLSFARPDDCSLPLPVIFSLGRKQGDLTASVSTRILIAISR